MINAYLAAGIQEAASNCTVNLIKWYLAMNKKLTKTALINLSKDPDEYVRRYLGENQDIPKGKKEWSLSAVFLNTHTEILYDKSLDSLTKEDKSSIALLLEIVNSTESLEDVLNYLPKIKELSKSQIEIFFKLAETWESTPLDLINTVMKI